MSKLKPTNFAVALSDFLFVYLPDQKGVSENTIKSYSDAFTLFLLFYETKLKISREKLKIDDISCDKFENFLDWIEQERHCSVSTRNQRRAAINTFFKYLQYKNPGYINLYQQMKAIPQKKYTKNPMIYLSNEDVAKILSMPKLSTKNGRRDFAILSLMYESAARVSEITNLVVADLRFNSTGTNVYILGKGRKARVVPLMTDVSKFLKIYLKDEERLRNCSKNEPLFCNKKHEKLTRSGIAYILNKYAKMANLNELATISKSIYPHILRHSRAMHWLEAGIDLFYIKDLLGHADLQTTEIYAKINTDMKRKALETIQNQSYQIEINDLNQDKDLLSWLKAFNN